MCAELPPAHKLQRALDRMGIAYHSFCLESGGRRKADQSRAIWNGICMWFARRLGPIPSALLATDAFDGLLWVLENRHQPLDKSCAYFRLSMVRPPLRVVRVIEMAETAFSLFPQCRDGLWMTSKDHSSSTRKKLASFTRHSRHRVKLSTGGWCVLFPLSPCLFPEITATYQSDTS